MEDPLVLLRIASLPVNALEPLRTPEAARLASGFWERESELNDQGDSLADLIYREAGEKKENQNLEQTRERHSLVALRRAAHNRRPLPSSSLHHLEGNLPPHLEEAIRGYRQGIASRSTSRTDFEREYTRALSRSREAVAEIARSPVLEEALRFASRSFHHRIREMGSRDPESWKKKLKYSAIKLAGYVGRAATKTSPNSLFCTTNLVELAPGTTQISGNNAPLAVDVLLSIGEVRKVTSLLAVDPLLRRAVFPRPNSTLRLQSDRWVFWRVPTLRDPHDEQILTSVARHPVVDAFLEHLQGEPLSWPELLARVGSEFEVDPEELEEFLEQVVAKGLLIAELEIPFGCRRPFETMARECRSADVAPSWLPKIEELERALDGMAAKPIGSRLESLREIEKDFAALPRARDAQLDELVRVDGASSFRITLPSEVVGEFESAVRYYARLYAQIYPRDFYASVFTRPFLERFRADEDVELLDLYSGVFELPRSAHADSFPEPMTPRGQDPLVDGVWRELERARDFFVDLARANPGIEEIEIGEAELHSLLGEKPEPQWMAGVLLQLAAKDPESLASGSYHSVLNGIFSGAGLALSRFSHLHRNEDDPIASELERLWSRMDLPKGAVRAEIGYMHPGRTANAGLRPRLFAYEIEWPGWKTSSDADRLSLNDLVVRFDSDEQRFVLRSVSRGFEVLPVLTSGVNPEGFVSFLVHIGKQDQQPLYYFPGFHDTRITRWPRFRFGRTVLFRRRWVENLEEFAESMGGANATDAEFFLQLARWRRDHGVPRHVFAHSRNDPKPFYVDLESTLFVQLLRRRMTASSEREANEDKNANRVTLVEMLPEPDGMWIGDSEGNYASEFLVHLGSEALRPAVKEGTEANWGS